MIPLFFPPTISNRRDFSSGYSRNYSDATNAGPEEEKAGTCSGPVRFLVLLRDPAKTGFTASDSRSAFAREHKTEYMLVKYYVG